jgi:hypothetical protein
MVEAELRFDRDVKLYVSDQAHIGAIVGAKAEAFSGDSPPPGWCGSHLVSFMYLQPRNDRHE